MKLCPQCQANVEGLLYRCDCCGAILEPQKKPFFTCGIYELPQCFGFSSLVWEMIDEMQPSDAEKYEAFLVQIGIRMICYPNYMLESANIKNRVVYSSMKRYASMTIIVSYDDFIGADNKEKAKLIASAIVKNIHLLQSKLAKRKLNVDDIVTHINSKFDKYIN